tara:strand:+ start:1657 stop:1902 length:246 start_codon:yes stop_codon:yes gene_type:complete
LEYERTKSGRNGIKIILDVLQKILSSFNMYSSNQQNGAGKMYKITCEDLETFTRLVVDLMKEGAGFEADASKLTIDLTGGY